MVKKGVILAGGKSSRMGRDKALLSFGGYATLAEYQYRRLSKLFDQVYISTKEDKFKFDAPLIFDNSKQSSPLVALVSIFKALGEEPFFLLSVDLPLLSLQHIEELLNFAKKEPQYSGYFFQTTQGLEPTAGIYRASYKELFLEQLEHGNHRLQEAIAKGEFASLYIDDSKSFFNMNSPKEYQKAKDLYRVGLESKI